MIRLLCSDNWAGVGAMSACKPSVMSWIIKRECCSSGPVLCPACKDNVFLFFVYLKDGGRGRDDGKGRWEGSFRGGFYMGKSCSNIVKYIYTIVSQIPVNTVISCFRLASVCLPYLNIDNG